MHRLLYSSTASSTLDDGEREALLGVSRASNFAAGLTGVLLYIAAEDHAAAAFVQVLEGDIAAVHQAYARIEQDGRHKGLRVLVDEPVMARAFTGWSMRLEVISVEQIRAVAAFTPGGATTAEWTLLLHDRRLVENLVSEYAH